MQNTPDILRPNPNSLPPTARGVYIEAGLSPGGLISLTLGEAVGLAGLRGLRTTFRDSQGSKDSRAFQVEVYDQADPPVLHHKEITELQRRGKQIFEHTVIVPADAGSGRKIIRDVIADATTFQISSILLSNEKGQLTKSVDHVGPDAKFEIKEYDPEEGYIRHTIVVDDQNRPSFEKTESREFYPQAGKVKRLKSQTSTAVEYAEDENQTVAAKFVRDIHYAPDGRTVLNRHIENIITPLSPFRSEDLHEIQEIHREISDDGREMIVEGVTDVYRPHDVRRLSSSKRWKEVSGKARRSNNLFRLETIEREIKYKTDGKEAEDKSKTTRWQYNEEDLPISVKVTSGLEPDYANYVFYQPDQKIPYARLRWDFHEQKYILYTPSSEASSDGHNHELDCFQSLDWEIKWKAAQEKEAGVVRLTPDYQTAGKIMQEMMVTPPASHTD